MKVHYTYLLSMLILLTSWSPLFAKGDDCEKPENLKSEMISPTSAKLSWSAVDESSGYFIRIKEGEDNSHDLDLELTVYNNWYVVEGLKPDEKYELRLRSLCGDDHSNWTEDFVFRTSSGNDPSGDVGNCAIPTGLAVSNISESSATISWNAVDGVDNYEVEVEDGENTPAFEFNSVTSAITVEVSGLAADGQYKVKVKSKCSGGNNSEYTDWLFFNATSGGGDPSTGSGDNCAIPTGLTFSNTSESSASISWNAVDGVDNYEVEVEDGENTPAFEFNLVTSATMVEVSGLAADGQYKVKVKSKCSGGNNSEYTDWLFFNATLGGGPVSNCFEPIDFFVTGITDTTATLSWSPVGGSKDYEIEFHSLVDSVPYHFNIIISDTSTTVLALQPGVTYAFRIKTQCASGSSSDYTEWISFTTTMDGFSAPDPPNEILITRTSGNWPPASRFETMKKQQALHTFKAFPNPVKDVLQLDLSRETKEKLVSIELLDSTGRVHKKIQQADFSGQLVTLSTNNLPSGLYVIVVRQNDSVRFSKKIMVAH